MAVMEVAFRAAPRRGTARPRSTVERPSAASVMSSRALLHAYHRQGDLGARDRLIEDYLPLVRRIARQHAGRGEPLEDLVQVGSIGLINAIDRFDLDRGVDLAAYAIPSIVGEIKRHLRDRVGPIRIPRRLQEVNASLNAGAAGLGAKLQRPATVAELAREAGVEHELALEALKAQRAHEPVSLSEDGNGEGGAEVVGRGRVRDGRGPCAPGQRVPRPRPAGAAAPPPRLLRGHEPGADRGRGRHLADSRLAPHAPGARETARRGRLGLETDRRPVPYVLFVAPRRNI